MEKVLKMNRGELELLYQRVFETSDAKLVLEDLKGRFFFYSPVKDLTEVGSENVIKHINNMINPVPEPEENPNGQFS